MLIEKYISKGFLPLIVILAAVILLIVFVLSQYGDANSDSTDEPEFVTGYFGETKLMLEVVDSPEERQTGLSGREELPEGTGMLFRFDEPDRHGIWMKDMLFSLDVLWLNEDFQIIYMVEGMTPESFPIVYRSSKPSLYVVELPAGFVATNGIEIHEQMTPFPVSE